MTCNVLMGTLNPTHSLTHSTWGQEEMLEKVIACDCRHEEHGCRCKPV